MVRLQSALVAVRFSVWVAASASLFGCGATESATSEDFGVTGEALSRRHREVMVFSSEFNRLHSNRLEQRTGELTRVSTVTLPEQVHYATPDPKRVRHPERAADDRVLHPSSVD